MAKNKLLAMNRQLCAFGMSWDLDGDYLRCRKCKQPQIASNADMAFAHTKDCRAKADTPEHPWLDLLAILKPLYEVANG